MLLKQVVFVVVNKITLAFTPYTLHLTPYTISLAFTPYTIHPSLYTLHLTLYTLAFTPYPLHQYPPPPLGGPQRSYCNMETTKVLKFPKNLFIPQKRRTFARFLYSGIVPTVRKTCTHSSLTLAGNYSTVTEW